MYGKVKINESPKFGLFLVILTVLASAMAVLFMLHTGTDDSSADEMDSGQCGDNVNYVYSSDGTLKISGTGGMYDYSKTNAPWSEYSSDIAKITIDNNITSLGEWAFRDCTNLKELTIPITLNSVRSNEHPAFAGCTNIETINLTYGTNGYGDGYAAYATDGCWYQNTPWYQSRDSLKELNLADNVKGIGSDTFRELNITSLVLPNTLSVAGDHCFFNCTKLTELTYPISLRPFCNKDYPAFWGCAAIEKVTFTRGNGVPYDYTGFFGASRSELAPWNINPDIAKTIVISDSVGRLGEYMFNGTNINEISLPISISFDDSLYAFRTMQNHLEKVTVTKGTGVGLDTTTDCKCATPWNSVSSVNTVVVEEGVTRIGYGTFRDCTIENIVLPNSLVSFGCGKSFLQAEVKNLTIPITVNAAWHDLRPAFYQSRGLEKVTFTPGDTGIGFDYSAYKGSNNWYGYTPWNYCSPTLKEIVFEDGIKSIGSHTFRELDITSVVIPECMQSLGNHTFFRCDKLTNLTIPISLNAVGGVDYPAFNGCNHICNITFTAGTGDWYSCQDSFEGSYYRKAPWNLTEADLTINISDGIDTIAPYAFYYCDRLHEIHFEGTCLEYIGDKAFEWCRNLESVSIPDSVTSIGTQAFRTCAALQSLTIGNSVKTVGDGAFARCSSLTDLIVPDSVTSIGDEAFSYCSSLTSADIGKSLPRIGDRVFADCSSLTNVTMWETTAIDPNAFVGCGDVKKEIK